MVKSASDYFDRLDNDPAFAREMSERQHRIGEWPRSFAYANELRESDRKSETRDIGTKCQGRPPSKRLLRKRRSGATRLPAEL